MELRFRLAYQSLVNRDIITQSNIAQLPDIAWVISRQLTLGETSIFGGPGHIGMTKAETQKIFYLCLPIL